MLDRLFGNAFAGNNDNVTDDNDTKALLYGPQFGTNDSSLDASKDLRIVVVCDSNMLDHFVFDSSRLMMKSSSMDSLASSHRLPPHRRSASSISSSVGYIASSNMQQEAPDPLTVSSIKQIAFGYTPIRFSCNITKLHTLPSSNMSDRRTWIVSRLFKVSGGEERSIAGSPAEQFISMSSNNTPRSVSGSPDLHGASSLPVASHLGSCLNSNSECGSMRLSTDTSVGSSVPSGPATRESTLEDAIENDDPSWTPRSNGNFVCPPSFSSASSSASASSSSSSKDIRCAICLIFNFSTQSQDLLTNHWNELSHALAELQKVVFEKLSESLYLSIQDYRFKSSLPSKISSFKYHHNYHQYQQRQQQQSSQYSLQSDEDVIRASYSFRHRFFNTLKIPRVICGQERWSDLYAHLYWSLYSLEGSVDNIQFISTMIAAFIRLHKDVIYDLNELRLRSSSARTVVMTGSPLVARKLIFILSSLLRDSTAQRLKKIADDHVLGLTKTASSPVIVGSPMSGGDGASSPRFMFKEGEGWELPAANSQTGQSQSIAMPQVVRPSFSSASLSNSLARSSSSSSSSKTIFPSLDGIRKSFANSASSGASYISSLLSPSELSYSDDSLEPHSFSDRPGVTRWHSQERTATTVNPLVRNFSSIYLNDMSEDDARFQIDQTPISTPTYKVHGDTVEVEFLSDDDNDTLNPVPIVLPPIVGFVSDFHPDFLLQACPITRDLETKISNCMNSDAELVCPAEYMRRELATTDCGQQQIVQELSKTLIVNVKRKELYEWTVIRTCTNQGCQDELKRKKIFGNKKPSSEYSELTQLVESSLKKIFEGTSPEITTKAQAVELLGECYLSLFNLLH